MEEGAVILSSHFSIREGLKQLEVEENSLITISLVASYVGNSMLTDLSGCHYSSSAASFPDG
jgi:hypothetical protein